MTLDECKTIELPTYKDNRGCLTLVESDMSCSSMPFVPKRCFWIHSVSSQGIRGEHAHRTCWELVIPVHGTFTLSLHDGSTANDIIADDPCKGIVIPPMIWCRLWNFSPGAVCLVLASEDYNRDGYINDFESFCKEATK